MIKSWTFRELYELELFLSVIELLISCWKSQACVDSVTKICPYFVDLD
jgi:hypothetical protein